MGDFNRDEDSFLERLRAARLEMDGRAAPLMAETDQLFAQLYGADEIVRPDRAADAAISSHTDEPPKSAASPVTPKIRKRIKGNSYLPHFDRLLTLTGVREPKRVAEDGTKWELWSAQEPDRFTGAPRALGIVLMLSKVTDERLRAIEAAMPGHFLRNTRLTYVIVPPVDVHDAYEQIKSRSREATVVSLRQWFSTVLNRLARPVERPFHTELPSFVDPSITVNGEVHDSATARLSAFLRHSVEGGAVGVLLGPAGVGKSTVVQELCRPPKQRAMLSDGSNIADVEAAIETPRLLVEDHHWQNLEKKGLAITADAVLKSALRENGFARDDLDQLDVLLSNGAITLVFDSFDEVCSHGYRTSANEILERILSLAELENSGTRVLITTRPEFWERVDVSLREQCVTFTLRPFDDVRIDKYVDGRFETEAGRARARGILKKLSPDVRAIPLVVASLCEAIAEGAEMSAFLEQTAAGIKRSNPLPGVARIMFFRESEKHGLPLSANDQAKFFSTLVSEYGMSFSDDDLIDAAQVEFQSLTATEALKLRDHFMITRTADPKSPRYSIRYPEMIQAIVAEETVKLLRELAAENLTAKHATTLRQFLTKAGTDLPAIIDRTGPDLQSLTLAEQARIWDHRTQLRTYADAQSTLFRILVEAQRPDAAGYRNPRFLPGDGTFQVAADYVQKGNLRKVDLRAVRFINVQFRDVEISSCLFSAVSEFAKCVMINCAVGRDCVGLRSEAIATTHCDDKTVANSKRWLQFPDVRPDVLAKIALRRVVYRVIEAAGETAFALGNVLAEDALEEHVIEVLKRFYIMKEVPWPVIEGKHFDAARRLVRNGEMVGAFQHAFRDVATWTSRDWRASDH